MSSRSDDVTRVEEKVEEMVGHCKSKQNPNRHEFGMDLSHYGISITPAKGAPMYVFPDRLFEVPDRFMEVVTATPDTEVHISALCKNLTETRSLYSTERRRRIDDTYLKMIERAGNLCAIDLNVYYVPKAVLDLIAHSPKLKELCVEHYYVHVDGRVLEEFSLQALAETVQRQPSLTKITVCTWWSHEPLRPTERTQMEIFWQSLVQGAPNLQHIVLKSKSNHGFEEELPPPGAPCMLNMEAIGSILNRPTPSQQIRRLSFLNLAFSQDDYMQLAEALTGCSTLSGLDLKQCTFPDGHWDDAYTKIFAAISKMAGIASLTLEFWNHLSNPSGLSLYDLLVNHKTLNELVLDEEFREQRLVFGEEPDHRQADRVHQPKLAAYVVAKSLKYNHFLATKHLGFSCHSWDAAFPDFDELLRESGRWPSCSNHKKRKRDCEDTTSIGKSFVDFVSFRDNLVSLDIQSSDIALTALEEIADAVVIRSSDTLERFTNNPSIWWDPFNHPFDFSIFGSKMEITLELIFRCPKLSHVDAFRPGRHHDADLIREIARMQKQIDAYLRFKTEARAKLQETNAAPAQVVDALVEYCLDDWNCMYEALQLCPSKLFAPSS